MVFVVESAVLYALERLAVEGWEIDAIPVDRGSTGLVMRRAGLFVLVWPDGEVTPLAPQDRGEMIGSARQYRNEQRGQDCRGSTLEASPCTAAAQSERGAGISASCSSGLIDLAG